MGITRFLAFCAVLALLPGQAFAARQCYSPAEMHAEQLLRLHSELMVIAYACKHSSQNYDLISVYTAFTQNNLGLLQNADQTLRNYFKGVDGGDGNAQLDDLHTKLGNEIGQVVADQSLETFCDNNRDRPLQMYFGGNVKLDKEIGQMIASAKSYSAPCEVMASSSRAGHMDKDAR